MQLIYSIYKYFIIALTILQYFLITDKYAWNHKKVSVRIFIFIRCNDLIIIYNNKNHMLLT